MPSISESTLELYHLTLQLRTLRPKEVKQLAQGQDWEFELLEHTFITTALYYLALSEIPL